MRDVWLIDDEPGCLECGTLHFRASRVPGVCTACLDEDIEPEDRAWTARRHRQ